MTDFLLTHWWPLSATAYVAGFLVVAGWEMVSPRRPWTVSTMVRWTNNFGVFAIGALCAYVCLPVLVAGFAVLVTERGWGLLNAWGWTGAGATVAGVLAYDLAQYAEHRLVHRVPWLWRCHRMHHADVDYDVTTGFRFHPLESLLAIGWRMMVVGVLGLPVAAVLLAELLLVVANYFVHGNVRVPLGLDRALRCLVVTPDLHRVHHSADRREANSNFGGILSVWDRMFRTYRGQPRAGHEGMAIGLDECRDPKHLRLGWMLLSPFMAAKERPTR